MSLTVNQKESLKWLSRVAGADSSIAAALADIEHLEAHLEASREHGDRLQQAYDRLKEGLVIPSDKIALENVRLKASHAAAQEGWKEEIGRVERLLADIHRLEGTVKYLELEVEAIGEEYIGRCSKIVTLEDGTTCARCYLPKDHLGSCQPEIMGRSSLDNPELMDAVDRENAKAAYGRVGKDEGDLCGCCGIHETVCPCVHEPGQTRCEAGADEHPTGEPVK